jgi:cutinase
MGVMSRLLVTGFLAAAAVTSSLIAPSHVPFAGADPCVDVEVVFARGTNEPAGLGGVGQPFVDSLRAQVDSRTTGGAYAVNYPASDDWVNSTRAGASDASAHVQSTIANCPGTKIVLGGYSQGAAVMEMMTASLPPSAADHVVAVALFGNPKGNLATVLSFPPLPAIGPRYAPKTIDLCVPEDPVCSNGSNLFAHMLYPQTGMTDQAAAFVAARVQ